ncbi:MAG: hypothetical protein Q4F35_00160 [Akkermansia sp.]|nr:hypothetical protein [Akkermansia sp.]
MRARHSSATTRGSTAHIHKIPHKHHLITAEHAKDGSPSALTAQAAA